MWPSEKPYQQRVAEDEARLYRKQTDKYKNNYLELRKMLREYSKENDVEFPPEIKKAIGLR